MTGPGEWLPVRHSRGRQRASSCAPRGAAGKGFDGMVIPATARHWYSEDTGEEQRCDACGRHGNGSFHRLTADPAGQVVIEGIAMESLTVLVVCGSCWARE